MKTQPYTEFMTDETVSGVTTTTTTMGQWWEIQAEPEFGMYAYFPTDAPTYVECEVSQELFINRLIAEFSSPSLTDTNFVPDELRIEFKFTTVDPTNG